MSEINGKDQINIRSKPTKAPEISKNNQELMPPSPELINDDLRAATAEVVVKMDSVDSVPSNKFKVKDPAPRSPAPMPEAISPAGVPIDLNVPETKDIPSSPKSVRGEFKIDLEGLDTTVEGMKPTEYKRNVKGSVVVIGLLLVSLHLFLNHLTMFTWVVSFDSPEQVIAAVLYVISTIIIIVMFLTALAVPALSIQEDKFRAYYSPILVAALIDHIAIAMGGGIFSPLSIYTLDPTSSSFYNGLAFLMTFVINGFLYYAFTRRPEDGKLFAMVHPFEKISEEEIEVNEAIEANEIEEV